MSRFWLHNLLLMLGLFTMGAAPAAASSTDLKAAADTYVAALMREQGIPGASVAIIRDGEVILRSNYGYANLEHEVTVSDRTIFRIFSLTKPFVATEVFRLVEAGTLSVDDPISEYIDGLPSEWLEVPIGTLLRHSSGLPDIKVYEKLSEAEAQAKIYADPIKFPPGSRFDYNQTNYWLLTRILEGLTDRSLLSSLIAWHFTDTTSPQNVFISTDSREIIRHRASSYFPFATGRVQIDLPYRSQYLAGANGLNLTLDAFIAWDAEFIAGRIISSTTKSLMWQSVSFENDAREWAYGWNRHSSSEGVSYGFSGSMVTAYRVFPDEGLSVIFLSNGFERWYDVEDSVDSLARISRQFP